MVTSNNAARLGGLTLGGHPSTPGAVMFAATSPRYARYVGRVGALAVALGVGVAVATGQGMGVARAETGTESGSPSDNPSAEPANNPPANADPTPPSPAPTTPPTETNGTPAPGAGSPTNNPAAPKMKLGTDGTVDTSHNDTGQATNDKDKGDVVTPTDVPPAPTTPPQSPAPSVPPVNPPVVNPPVVTENPPVVPENRAPQGNSAPAGTPNTPINPPPADPDTGDSEQTVIEHDSSQQMAARLSFAPQDVQPSAGGASLMMTAAAAVVNTPAPAPLLPQPAGPIDVLLGIPGVVVNIATTVVATLLSAFLAPGQVAPAQPPVLFALLAWVQREMQRTFFNSTPDGVIDTVTTSEDIAKTFPVLGNDTDADTAAGDVITVTDYTQPANGTVALNPDGTFTYTPDADFNGTDTFTYTVSDAASPWHVHGLSGFFFGGGHTDTTTVTITVNPVNDKPVAVADAYTMDEDTVLTVNKPGVLTNDTDVDHPVINPALDLTAVKVVGSGPTNGTVAFYSDGSFIYTPNLNFNGTDSFSYVANDFTVDSAPTTVTITVNPVNDAPVAVADDTATTNEDTPIDISVLGNDTDIDSPTLTVSSATSAHGGTVTINPNGTLHYTPAANFNGTDTLTYTVSDGALTDTGTVTVTVTPASDVVDNITFPDGASPSGVFVAGTDPTKIYVLTGDELRIVDTTTGNVIDTVELGTTPWSAAVSPDARYVYVGKVDGSGQTLPITKIDIQTGAATPIGGVRQPSAMAISADGATLYVTNYQDGTVSVINTATGDYYTIDTGLQSDAIAVSADGRTLYVGSIINDVRVVNIATKTYTTVATGTYDGMTPADQSITVAGRYVYVTDGLNDKVAVIDTVNNTVIDRVDVGDRPSSVTVSPGGAFVFVANAGSDSVSVIDTETGSVVTTFPVGNNPTHVDLSSDGTRLYVTTSDGISAVPTANIYFIFGGSGDDGPGWSVGVGTGGGGPVLPPVVPGGGLGGGGTGPTLPPIVPGGPGPVNPPGEIYV